MPLGLQPNTLPLSNPLSSTPKFSSITALPEVPQVYERRCTHIRGGVGKLPISFKYISDRRMYEHNFALPCLEDPVADADDVTERTSKRQKVA